MSSGDTRRSVAWSESLSLGCKYGFRRVYLSQNGYMWTTRSFMGWKLGIGSIAIDRSDLSTVRTGVLHARPVVPLMFIEHEPQIAERHERRNVIEPSISALACSSASRTVAVSGRSVISTRSGCGTSSVAWSKRKMSRVYAMSVAPDRGLPLGDDHLA